MVLINTRFYTDPAFTRSVFFDLITRWLRSSSFADISIDGFDFGQDEFFACSEEDKERSLSIGNYEKVFILTHSNPDKDSTYITSYVLDDTSDKPSLYLHQEKTFTKASFASQNADIQFPDLLKSIFWNEYGGNDNGLMTLSEPIILRKSDVGLAKEIINNTSAFLNPVVYVSPNASTGQYHVDCERLAQELEGQAHVVVESSPVTAAAIALEVSQCNPYNGAVKIYVPGGDTHTIWSKEQEMASEIVCSVRQVLSCVSVPDEFNAVKLRQMHKLSKLGDDSELSRLCEEMLKEKDNEISALNDQLSELKRELYQANNKASSLEYNLESQSEDSGKTVVFEVTESDLYDGEIKSVVRKVLQKEYDSMKDDPNLSSSRKFDVLSDILDHCFPCTTDADLVRCIRRAFNDGVLTREGIGCLQSSGFEVEKGENGHYKVSFGKDKRYSTVFSSTPSDKSRGAKNCVSDFVNVLFGY